MHLEFEALFCGRISCCEIGKFISTDSEYHLCLREFSLSEQKDPRSLLRPQLASLICTPPRLNITPVLLSPDHNRNSHAANSQYQPSNLTVCLRKSLLRIPRINGEAQRKTQHVTPAANLQRGRSQTWKSFGTS
jgi:hypothetical protein